MCILGKGCTSRDGSIIFDIRTGRGHLNGGFTINSSLVPQLASSFLFNGTFRSCDSFHVGQGRTSSFRYVQTCADNVGVGNSASRTVRGTHAYRAIIANSLNRTVIGDAIIGCGHGHGTSISRNSVVGDAGSGGQGNVAACTANDEAAIAVVNGRASIHGDTRACSNVGIVLDIRTCGGHFDSGSSLNGVFIPNFADRILINFTVRCLYGRIIGQGCFGVLDNVGSRRNSTGIFDTAVPFGRRIHGDGAGGSGYDIVGDVCARGQGNVASRTADGNIPTIVIINSCTGIHGDATGCSNVGIVLDARTGGSHADGGSSVNCTYVVDCT